MAIDHRLDLPFVPGPPAGPDVDAAAPPAMVAPLRPMDRAWLLTWRARLDPRRHAGVPATTVVSTLVRQGPGAPPPGWRYLAPAALATTTAVANDPPVASAPA